MLYWTIIKTKELLQVLVRFFVKPTHFLLINYSSVTVHAQFERIAWLPVIDIDTMTHICTNYVIGFYFDLILLSLSFRGPHIASNPTCSC